MLWRLDRDDVQASQATSPERRNTGMHTVREVRAIVANCIVREELVTANRPEQVRLDGPLTDALHKKKKNSTDNTNDPTPISLSRMDIDTMWSACQHPAYALIQIPENVILEVEAASRRQANKCITRVLGLEERFGVDACGGLFQRRDRPIRVFRQGHPTCHNWN